MGNNWTRTEEFLRRHGKENIELSPSEKGAGLLLRIKVRRMGDELACTNSKFVSTSKRDLQVKKKVRLF